MKNLVALLLAVLVSCAPDDHSYPDASPPSIDASRPDASPPPDSPPNPEGCSMTNLPYSRDETITQGAPVPPDLLNALQDMHVGDKRTFFTRRYYPRFIVQGGWADGALVTAGLTLPGYTSTGVTPAHVEIPYDVGDHLVAMTFQACGNGVTDLQVDLQIFGDYINPSLSLGNVTDNNRSGAAWGTVVVAVDTTRPALVDGGLAKMVLTASAAGYTIGQISATFERK